MDPAIIGTMRIGYFRIGVFNDVWDRLLKQYEDSMNSDFSVTRREIVLGNRDSVTGWRSSSWQTSTIDMIIFERGSTVTNLPAGAYIHIDALGMTADPCKEGDQIYWNNIYYEVEARRKISVGDSLAYYYYDLVKLPLYQASPQSATWKTSPYDPCYLVKNAIETYARDAQITKDDGSTLATWVAFFENPPYPLELEFTQHGGIDCAYVIGEVNSTPEVSGDQIVRRYEEKVPIHVCTLDREGISGRAMKHKMVSELRYVFETNPTGSQRNLGEGRKNDRALGSMWLYDQEYILSYKKGTSA